MDTLNALFRWLHILAGIIWIGMLFFFNWVNGPFAATMDGDTKKKVVPELMPRALWWFRWGAVYTWVTGVLLLMLVFYHGGIMFDGDAGWSAGAIVMVAFSLVLAPLVYDALQKSPLGKDPKVFGAVMYALIAVVLVLMSMWGKFSYRATNIHLGALFGTVMIFNVWSRIWPNQQKIITAVKNGTAPDAALVSLAGTRSRHNVYMGSVLLWTMINQHTTTVPLQLGIPAAYASIAMPLVVILVAWHLVWQLYRRAGKVKGF